MPASDFVDYYERLEISPNANPATIERMFRYFAARYHPDNRDTGDRQRFDAIIEAHGTLRDSNKRAQYDAEYQNRSSLRSRLIGEASDRKGIANGVDIQNTLLSLLYARCRQNVREPGIGDAELERLSGCPAEHLEFHLWYLKGKGWVRRIGNGTLAITVEGIDHATSDYQRQTINGDRLADPA